MSFLGHGKPRNGQTYFTNDLHREAIGREIAYWKANSGYTAIQNLHRTLGNASKKIKEVAYNIC